MIEALLIILVILTIVNIVLIYKKEIKVDIKSQMKDVETSIAKFDSTLEKIEKSIKDEFQRNRTETNQTSRANRDELTKNLLSFEKQFSENINILNELLRQNFNNFGKHQTEINKQSSDNIKEVKESVEKSLKSIRSDNTRQIEEMRKTLSSFEKQSTENIKLLNELLSQKFNDFGKHQTEINKQASDNIKDIKESVEKNLKSIRSDNSKQLEEMRKTVDEKLQTTLEKRLSESFKQVSERLEQVHKGLGEMQNIATGVGDLKKVLSNVKTRGILGEYQLANILEQILAPEQYGKNVATKKGSQANVEYAIKLPGKSNDEEVWMPIDSKFPLETYNILLSATEEGDVELIEKAQKQLLKTIESFAKDISRKYIDPPHTTDFGIMFLPVESLYAEVLRHPGLFETLQRKYKITVTGPTTLSALLNSLQMGFRTLAVQKRSSEVWDILKAVKFEFNEFSCVLAKVHKQIDTASTTLEKLRTTRTNVLERKLRNVEIFSASEASEVLELQSNEDVDEK